MGGLNGRGGGILSVEICLRWQLDRYIFAGEKGGGGSPDAPRRC